MDELITSIKCFIYNLIWNYLQGYICTTRKYFNFATAFKVIVQGFSVSHFDPALIHLIVSGKCWFLQQFWSYLTSTG